MDLKKLKVELRVQQSDGQIATLVLQSTLIDRIKFFQKEDLEFQRIKEAIQSGFRINFT